MQPWIRVLLEEYIIPIFGLTCWNRFLSWTIGSDILLEQIVSSNLIYFWYFHIRGIYYHTRAIKGWENSIKRREEQENG